MIIDDKNKSKLIKVKDIMKDGMRSKHNVARIIMLALIIIALGSLYLVYAWNRHQKATRSDAIMLAQSLESVFYTENIAELSGSIDDIDDPDYELKKLRLMQLVETTNPIRFAYLMREDDGNIIFLVDSEPVDSIDYSPPGQVYEEADDILWGVFHKGETVLTKPTTDRWGTWISVLVPVKDPINDKTIAVFGIDYSAAEWHSQIWKLMIPDIIIFSCILLILFAALHNWIQRAKIEFLRERLSVSEEYYRSIFDRAPVGIALINDSGVIAKSGHNLMNYNREFERILGRSGSDLINVNWMDITHPDDLQADLDKFEKFKSGEISSYSMDKRYLRPDGSSIWVNMTISTHLSASDREFDHICIIRDISDSKELEELIKEKSRMQAVLLSNLPGLAYRCNYDREWTMQFVSDGSVELTGYTPESLINNRDLSYNDIIAPEYREPLWKAWKTTLANRAQFRYEYEIMTASDTRKWVLEIGQGVYNEQGEVEMIEGLVLDMSDKKKAENQLMQSLERTQSMINNHEAVMLLIEPISGKIIEANHAAISFYGYSREELLNMSIQDINTLDKNEVAIMRMKALNKGQKYFTFPHRLKSGEIKIVDVYSCPIDYDEKKVLYSIIFDVTKREEITKQNQFLAYHDFLTGLYNRRFFVEEFDRRVKGNNFPVAILMGDIDGFKVINDTFGHAEGDRILKELASIINEYVNAGDVFARIGGDEFAILTSGKNESDIRQYLDDLDHIHLSSLQNASEKSIINISWGYGIQRKKEDTLDVLNEEAEAFLNNRKFFSRRSVRSKTVDVIMEALFAKSEREEKHSKRVGILCEAIAQKMRLAHTEIDKIRVAGYLHDIGKIGIDENVLNKPGKLDNKEWELMKLHPAKSASILENTTDYRDIADIVLSHHERFDGFGYPNGLKAMSIPIGARIIAVADTYDAITNERPYRKAMEIEEAKSEIIKCSGTQFDPEIVSVFINEVIGIE